MSLPYLPGLHRPLHSAVVAPLPLPYVPAGHGLHAAAPPPLYHPAGHTATVGTVEPAGQAYPGAHGPLQLDDVAPDALP